MPPILALDSWVDATNIEMILVCVALNEVARANSAVCHHAAMPHTILPKETAIVNQALTRFMVCLHCGKISTKFVFFGTNCFFLFSKIY